MQLGHFSYDVHVHLGPHHQPQLLNYELSLLFLVKHEL